MSGTEVLASEAGGGRATCYRCFRPRVRCICACCRRVHNRTFVHVLQHPRERFHPFGTARIVELTLARSAVHVAFGRTQHDVHHRVALPPDTALLYPGKDAPELSQLPAAQRPRNLLVLDGTWRQAHQLYRDNPWLAALPQVRLDPLEPSRYRIRKEPADHCLSTVESILAALRSLEPETPELENLTRAFDAMIEQQLAHPRDPVAPVRHKVRRPRPSRAIPEALRGDPARIVLVYGESSQITTRRDPRVPELLQWTALRLATGARFECFLRGPGVPPAESFLARMGLTSSDLARSVTGGEFRALWREFAAPSDLLVAWNGSSFRLLAGLGVEHGAGVLLKAAYANAARRRPGKLETVVAREHLTARELDLRGRAAERLANAAAIADWLRAQPTMARSGLAPGPQKSAS